MGYFSIYKPQYGGACSVTIIAVGNEPEFKSNMR